MLLNIVSSSGGGRFERDHAAAMRWGTIHVSAVRHGMWRRTCPNDTSQLLYIQSLSFYEVNQRIGLLWF